MPLAGSGSDSVSDNALVTLRSQVLPETLGKVAGVAFAVTGSTAVNHDWSQVLRSRTPIVLGVVAGLAFLVLLFSFRSVLLPLISIGLNLLSAGAAYGLIVLIFQDGRPEPAPRFALSGESPRSACLPAGSHRAWRLPGRRRIRRAARTSAAMNTAIPMSSRYIRPWTTTPKMPSTIAAMTSSRNRAIMGSSLQLG